MSEMAPRVSPPYHERDSTPSAPGDLELIRSFVSLHDHVPPSPESLPPGSDTIVWWLRTYGGLPADAEPAAEDVAWAAAVLEALRARVRENEGAPRDRAAIRVLDAAAREAGLEVRFGDDALRPMPAASGAPSDGCSRPRSSPSSTDRGRGSGDARTRTAAPSSGTARRTTPAAGARCRRAATRRRSAPTAGVREPPRHERRADRAPAAGRRRGAGRPLAHATVPRLLGPAAARPRRGRAHAAGHPPRAAREAATRHDRRGAARRRPHRRPRARALALGAHRDRERAPPTSSGSTRISRTSTPPPKRTPISHGCAPARAGCSGAPRSGRT